MTIIRGNELFPEVESKYTPEGHPKLRVMTPPELLQEVATELMRLDEFDLAVALRDTATRWDEPYGCRPQIWASRVEAALECGLDELSRIRLEVVLAKVKKLASAPAAFSPYELYVVGEIFLAELRSMIGGEVDMDELAAVREELGAEVAA